MDEIILLNRIRVDIGNVSGSISELLQYAGMLGFNDNYEPQAKPRLVGTWTVNDWYTTAQLAQAQAAFDGLTIVGDPNYLINFNNFAVQTLDSTQPNYNPAVGIRLYNLGYGTVVNNYNGYKGWFLTKTQASQITYLNFVGCGTSITDSNAIVNESQGDTTKTYNFKYFDEGIYFTGITSIYDVVNGGWFFRSGFERIILPSTVTTLSSGSADWAPFKSMPATHIVLQENVTAFYGVVFDYITFSLTIKATTPPSFSSSNTRGCTILAIYVPSDLVNTYKSASGWSKYASIIQAIPQN